MKVGDRVRYVGVNKTYIGQADGCIGTVTELFDVGFLREETWAGVKWDHGESWGYPIVDLALERMAEQYFDLEDIELSAMIMEEIDAENR